MVIKICVRCNKEKKHYAKGLCRYCYTYSKFKHHYIKEAKKWKEKNPEYFKEYYLIKKQNEMERIA